MKKAAQTKAQDQKPGPAFCSEGPPAPWPERLAWLPILFFLIAIGLLAVLRIEAVWLPPLLLPALNVFFLTFVSFLVSVLAARSYLVTRSPAVLFLGCGTLALGLASAVAVITPGKPDPNWTVTIYNMGACLAGICHLVSALLASFWSKRPPRSGRPFLVSFYLVVIAIIAMLAMAVHHDLLPTFFIEGQGATDWDVLILWTTAGLFTLSALLLSIYPDENKDDFRRWYGLGLGLIAVGLIGVSAQTRLGDPLNWAGRTSQYLGGMYMLMAVISSIRRTGTWLLPLEQALRESEGRYQSLVHLCPDAILVHANGKYVFANPAAAKLFGALSPEEVVGKKVMDLVHPDHQYSFAQPILQCYDCQGPPLRETRLVRLDGRPLDVEVTGAAVDFSGEPAVQIVLRDITERKQAEAALEAAKIAAVNESNRLQAVMEALPVGVAILDAHGGTVLSNSMFEKVWGDPRPATRKVDDYAAYNAWWVDTGEQVQPEQWASAQAVQQGKTVVGQLMEIERFDGRRRFVINSASPIRDGDGILNGCAVAILDITDLKQAEAALREAHERAVWLARFPEENPNLVARASADGNILYLNPATARLPGWTSTVGQPVPDPFLPLVRHAMTGARDLHQDVELGGRLYSVSVAPFSPEGYVNLYGIDVTDRRQAEEALRTNEARFRLLSETAARLLAAEDPQAIVNELCGDVMAYLDCDVFFNFLVDEKAGKLHLNAFAGISQEEARKLEWLQYGVAVCGCVAQEGRRILAEDIRNTADPRTELVRSFGIQAYACHPLMARGQVIGTLSFGTQKRSRFTTQDLVLMKTVADQVALAMERMRLIRELQKSRDELEIRVLERTKELLQANEEISDLYNKAPCGYHALGPDGTFLLINDTELHWLGYARDEIIGKKKWSDLLTPVGQKAFQLNYPLFKKQGFINDLEYDLIRKDGSMLRVLLSATAVRDAEGRYLMSRGTIVDVTERKRAEEEITRGKAMLQKIFDGISDPLLLIGKDLSVKMINEAAHGYFQINDTKEAFGRTCFDLTRGRCASCDGCAINSALSKGEKVTFERMGLFEPERVEQITVYPAEDASNEVSDAIIRISDITEIKNLEKHMMRVDRLSSLGQLSGGIAHEIRNPLAGINLFVDVLSDEERFSRTSQELNILEEIKSSIKKIDGIIKRVLDFSRQSKTSSLTKLEIGSLMDDTLKLWRSRIGKEGIELRVFIEEDLPDILGDPIEIQQVLNNLVGNAVDAMSGGGLLSIAARRCTLSAEKKRPAVSITVQDNGSGIPVEAQDSIFNPFFTTKPAGTGLGLAISHRIISRHGGIIFFETSENLGTTFHIEFPIASGG